MYEKVVAIFKSPVWRSLSNYKIALVSLITWEIRKSYSLIDGTYLAYYEKYIIIRQSHRPRCKNDGSCKNKLIWI